MFVETPFSVHVREPEGVLAFTRDDMIAYAGLENLIASAVTLRLLSRAFADLTEDGVPVRRDIRILTAFAGEGVRDCIELVTRAVTQGRFVLDQSAAEKPATPLGGAMYFEVAYRGRAMAYTFSDSVFDDEWCRQVSAYQRGADDPAVHAAYVAYKFAKVGSILADPNVFADVRPCSAERLMALGA